MFTNPVAVRKITDTDTKIKEIRLALNKLTRTNYENTLQHILKFEQDENLMLELCQQLFRRATNEPVNIPLIGQLTLTLNE